MMLVRMVARVVNEPSIEIIIPNWNGAKMLSHCLESLERQTFLKFSVTVVDNGSVDNSLELLEKKFPEVKIVSFETNRGFSVAVNAGIESTKSEWILLLNNDMEVASDCLEQLVSGILGNSGYDFFSLKMMNFAERELIDGAGDAMLRGGVGYRLGTLEKDGPRFQADRECFGACGGAALYKRENFEKVGLFDADFFAYLEDVDLNLRMRRGGLKALYLSKAIVFHIGSATSGSKINELTVRLSTRNNINLIVKNYSFYLFLRFLPALFVYQSMWFVFCCKHRMFRPYFTGFYQGVMMISQFSRKREGIKKCTVVGDRELAALIINSEKDAVESIMSRRSAAGKGNFILQLYCKLFF